jgi:hypothetical protein
MSETEKTLGDILKEALGQNTGDNTETLGDILGAALQLVAVEEQLPVLTPNETPSEPSGDVLGAALRTATEQQAQPSHSDQRWEFHRYVGRVGTN